MLRYANVRAKRQGVPCDITVADIQIPTHCPVLGMPLVVGHKVSQPDSPTLDKLRPELGYVRGNIMVISHRANTLKNNASCEELTRVLAYMRQHNLHVPHHS